MCERVADLIPIGVVPCVFLLISILTGLFLVYREPPANDANLVLWTFSNTHYDSFKQTAPDFESQHTPFNIELQMVNVRVLDRRLRAAMWAGLDVPDLVEVNFNRAGTFFRGPVDKVGFIDLTPYLQRTNGSNTSYMERVLPSRLAVYTNRGRIFGLPHDVHPHTIAYRKDIFDAEGIDVDTITTWDDFIAVGRKLTIPDKRYMIQLDDLGVLSFEALLLQRGGGFFNKTGELTIDDEVTYETMLWFVPLVTGADRIADNPAAEGQSFYKAVADGYVLSFLCPDWLTSKIEMNLPQLHGKMALMPLPAVEPGGRRTTARSGTMLGITTSTTDPEQAWELAKFFYFDPEQTGIRFRTTNTIPPNRDAWDHPAFHEPRSYWSGQRIGEIYIALADQVPTQYSHPFQEIAATKVAQVIASSCAYYREHGEAGFEAFVREQLNKSARTVRLQMNRNRF